MAISALTKVQQATAGRGSARATAAAEKAEQVARELYDAAVARGVTP
jgi:hypothetical protein